MDNLQIYNAVRSVPPTAQKKITGGRLNGKTDINPMWRIKALTEMFGACGIGWKYEIVKMWAEPASTEETAAFVQINLYVKGDGGWSEPIPGIGGNMFREKEKSGIHTNDECYKMALTDAISVSCKALGFGADIYWENDKSKYDKPDDQSPACEKQPKKPEPSTDTPQGMITKEQRMEITNFCMSKWGKDAGERFKQYSHYLDSKAIPTTDFDNVMKSLYDAPPF